MHQYPVLMQSRRAHRRRAVEQEALHKALWKVFDSLLHERNAVLKLDHIQVYPRASLVRHKRSILPLEYQAFVCCIVLVGNVPVHQGAP